MTDGPTLFVGVDHAMRTARTEFLGPVGVIPFGDKQEAIRVGNDSEFGSAAGVWSGDPLRALRVSCAPAWWWSTAADITPTDPSTDTSTAASAGKTGRGRCRNIFSTRRSTGRRASHSIQLPPGGINIDCQVGGVALCAKSD